MSASTQLHTIRRGLGKWMMVLFLLEPGLHAHTALGADIDPSELMRRVERQASASDETVRIEMTLIDADGQERRRSAVFYRRQRSPGSLEDLKLIRFNSPAEMARSAVLTIENVDQADNQWLYLPAARTSRRVPSSNRSDRYMGTDFAYEDVSDDKTEEYRYKLAGSEEIDGRRYLIVDQQPVAEETKRESAYGRKRQWVDPERLLVANIDYFDKNGTLIKRYRAAKPEKVNGYWRWGEGMMSDLRLNHRTRMVYRDRTIGTGLNADLFTVRYLERGR